MTQEQVQPRRLVAILAADVVGYSRLVGEDEEGTIARLKDLITSLFDPKIAQHGGRVVKTMGDGLLIEFDSAVAAARCAVEVQEALHLHNVDVPEQQHITFRVGINVGDIIVDGDDILGDGVNVAARLEGIAEPGGICISNTVFDQIDGKLDLNFIDLGEQSLKNIDKSIRAYALASAVVRHPRIRSAPGAALGTANIFDVRRFTRPSIIVMPFRDLGGADENSLAEGLRLSVHSVLVKLSGLFLLHTALVEGYRGQHYSASDVGKEIDVRYVVGGTVQCRGERVRVSVELTDTTTRQVVWAENYDRVMDDIFSVQDEIALEIVNALDIELRGGEAAHIRSKILNDPSARVLMHRAAGHLYQGDRQNNSLSRDLLEKLDEIEPDVPLTSGMIAITHWRDARFGWSVNPLHSLQKAGDYAQKAIDLGDTQGIGHTVMGYVHLQQRRHNEAMQTSAEALSTRSSCPLANGLAAEVLRYCGKADQSIMRMREAMKIVGTFPPWMVSNLAAALRDHGQIEASISAANDALQLFPEDLDLLVTLCSDYELSAMPSQAETVAKQIIDIDPTFTVSRYADAQPYSDRAVLNRIVESLTRAGLPQ